MNQSAEAENGLLEIFTRFYVTGFGTGLVKRAPGTVGTLVGIPLAFGLSKLGFYEQFAVAALIWLTSVPLCTYAARLYGNKDPQVIVVDEIAAFPFVFLCVPFGMVTAVAGFCWFRVFDITKPWPCQPLERLPGGWGIMIDDLIAAFYAAVTLWCTIWLGGMIFPNMETSFQ